MCVAERVKSSGSGCDEGPGCPLGTPHLNDSHKQVSVRLQGSDSVVAEFWPFSFTVYLGCRRTLSGLPLLFCISYPLPSLPPLRHSLPVSTLEPSLTPPSLFFFIFSPFSLFRLQRRVSTHFISQWCTMLMTFTLALVPLCEWS